MYLTRKENKLVYPIPKENKKMYSKGLQGKHIVSQEDKICANNLRMVLNTGISSRNYAKYFHHLLWFEEVASEDNLRKSNMKHVRLQGATRGTNNVQQRLYRLRVPGLQQKRPSLLIGDIVIIKSEGESETYITKIIKMDEVELTIELIKKVKNPTGRAYGLVIDTRNYYNVIFVLSRFQFINLHLAVDKIMDHEHMSKIFPTKQNTRLNVEHVLKWFNPVIARNPEQRAAVKNIVAGSSGRAPFILHGPPGTGKTATIVEAILQILATNSSNKIMVCAPSNSAADDVACKLIKYQDHFSDSFLLRRNSANRDWSTLPDCLMDCSRDPIFKRGTPCSEQVMAFVQEASIVVSTISHAPQAVKSMRYLTHLFIDEAAQATEAQCLLPIVDLLTTKGQLVLSGDHLQLGPVIMSQQAKEYGLGLSLMERLMNNSPLYSETSSNPNYMIMLKKNFRSHADILCIPNTEFYQGRLQACATVDSISNRNILTRKQNCHAIAFHAVYGTEMTDKSSYFNEMELQMVKLYVRKLIRKHQISVNDIGIITPYMAQVSKLREWLKTKSWTEIELGSVETFQGKEKKVIIMSTVRDIKLGFLVDRKRFNVALTRAKAKLIVVGNPDCLKKDKMWRIYINKCKDLGSYQDTCYEDYCSIRLKMKNLKL